MCNPFRHLWTFLDTPRKCEKCCTVPTSETKYFVGAGRYRPSIHWEAVFGLEKDFVCPRLETVRIREKTKQSGCCQTKGIESAVSMDNAHNSIDLTRKAKIYFLKQPAWPAFLFWGCVE